MNLINKKNMKTMYKMKEATNKLEAIMTFSDVRDLFIEIKKEYYNSIDWTNKF